MSRRVVIVGCGRHSTSVHGPALERLAGEGLVTLAACCDVDAERARAFATRFGFANYYTDLDELMTVEQPAAAVLIAPVELTCALGCELLAYRVPLLLEKPPGLTVAETDRLAAAAGETPHLVAFNRRFVPLIREARRRIDELGGAGAVHHIHYDFARYHRTEPDFSTTAIHGLDAVRHLAAADYADVHLRYRELPELGPGVANYLVDARMTSGATAQLSFTPVAGAVVERARIELHGHSLFLQIPIWGNLDQPGLLRHLHQGEEIAHLTGEQVSDGQQLFEHSGFYGEHRAFHEALTAGRRPAPDLAASRQSVALAQALRERRPCFP